MTILTLILLGLFAFALGTVAIVRMRRARAPDPAPAAPVITPASERATELSSLLSSGAPGGIRIDGDLHVAGKFTLPVGLLVRGSIHVADEGELDAVTEVFGDLRLGSRARATRAFVVHGELALGEDSVVPSCHVDGDAHLAAGARVDGALTCGTLFLDTGPQREPTSEPIVAFERA